MIIEDIKNIKSGKKDLRRFGITMAIALAVVGSLVWWRGSGVYQYLYILSGVFLIFGVMVPLVLKPVQKIWMTFAIIIGWFMTRLILCILFYLVFTLTALAARLFGKQFLDLNIDTSASSYWKYRKQTEVTKDHYERQF